MQKKLFGFLITLLIIAICSPVLASDLSNRLKGKILLQVEDNGEAWYINPDNENRYFMGRPVDAFALMRALGLGISNKDFNSFNGFAPTRLSGKILLQVEENGEAWYVDPTDLKMHFLGRPADAFSIMRELGLGIINSDLTGINIAEGYGIKETETPVDTEGPVDTEEPVDTEDPEDSVVCAEAFCQVNSLLSYDTQDNVCVEVIDDCSDCSCECGGFNTEETVDNNNCEDSLDNDCDALTDSEEEACAIEGTEVGGEINKNTSWILSASPYIVTGDVDVLSNATLTIDPGVEVKFKTAPEENVLGGYELIIRGGLKAIGSAENMIIFTSAAASPATGDWWGIEAVDGGTLELEYTEIEYAQYGVSAANTRLANMKNNTISNCVVAIMSTGPGEIMDNYIDSNQAGIVVQTDTSSPRDSESYIDFSIRLLDIRYNTIQNNLGDIDNPGHAGVVIKGVTTPDIALNLEYNEISFNANGINFTGSDYFNGLTIKNNNIVENDVYNIWFDAGSGTVTLENNWWGTTEPDPITEGIYDYFDVSTTLPQADYNPISLVAQESAGVR